MLQIMFLALVKTSVETVLALIRLMETLSVAVILVMNWTMVP